MSLSVGDFETFHRAVHGHDPFDWQSRLLREIIARNRWPRVLDLPTGSGKTTCIDVALFALALDASRSPTQRWCPRRIAMVVDRRVVVDQAAERGRKLLQAMAVATGYRPGDPLPTMPSQGGPRVLTSTELDVLRKVSDALASLSDAGTSGASPLAVFTLRGGIPKDDGWARTPDQPLVIASTVDQLGSRLLVRGYGVSPEMRPVHAGLTGNDMLILLDEVHLSEPFRQTLEALESLRERFAGNGLPRRFQFAFLSATPGESTDEPFRLTEDDLAPASALGPRLYATKPASIETVSGRGALAASVARSTARFLEKHTVVATVVNRVDTALEVFASLKKSLDGDVVLLTGRMRPLDRDDVLSEFRPRIATGSRTHAVDERRLVVVGTQCIEAGADFDFDALVTESASFDGLRQRFGRVDRLGEYKDAHGAGRAEGVIIHDRQERSDPIYEDRIAETVKWLNGRTGKNKTADFGSMSLLDAPLRLSAPSVSAPMLMPAYLDLWSQTSPEPFAVPEPGLFLHGLRVGPADVQVIWRVDLDEDTLTSQHESNVVAAIAAVRPSSLEAISLPFGVARRWLAQEVDVLTGTADLEITDEGVEPKAGGRRAVRWLGKRSQIVDASSIRPGDTLVVPSSYGGIDAASRCFNPDAKGDVHDFAERASLMSRGRALLRLHPRVLAGLNLDLDHEDPESARGQVKALASELTGWKRVWAESIGNGRKAHAAPWDDVDTTGSVVLEGQRVKAELLTEALDAERQDPTSVEDGTQLTTDDDTSLHTGTEVRLDVHTRDVEERVRGYAQRLGLREELASDLSLAAWLHDIGKADRRFQRMLRGGSEIAYYRDEHNILAKSAMASDSPAEHQRAQLLSGYPQGTRHEVQSLAMIDGAREQIAPKAHDFELVMHLVASHHGYCRPFAPAIEDTAPVHVMLDRHTSDTFGAMTFGATLSAHLLHQLDSPLVDRFWSLVAKYGWIELCWLEAIFRLADHRASEIEAGGSK